MFHCVQLVESYVFVLDAYIELDAKDKLQMYPGIHVIYCPIFKDLVTDHPTIVYNGPWLFFTDDGIRFETTGVFLRRVKALASKLTGKSHDSSNIVASLGDTCWM